MKPKVTVTLYDSYNRPIYELRIGTTPLRLDPFRLDQLFKPWTCTERAKRIEITA